jgi:hypothetical protein
VTSTIIWKKKMAMAETYQNWFYVPTKLNETFPRNSMVNIKIKNQTVRFKVNSYGYMSPDSLMSSQFYRLLRFDKERDTMVFLMDKKGLIELTVEKG